MTGDDLLVGADVDENIDGNNESVTSVLTTDHFDLPLVLRIGVSDDISIGSKNQIMWSIDAVSPNDNANYVNAGGAEKILDELITVHFGINSLLLDDSEREFSFV